MARAVPSHHGRFRADARSYLPAIVIVTVHSSLLLPAPCGAALALVTVSLTSALWRRPTKAVTSLRPSKFTSEDTPRNAGSSPSLYLARWHRRCVSYDVINVTPR